MPGLSKNDKTLLSAAAVGLAYIYPPVGIPVLALTLAGCGGGSFTEDGPAPARDTGGTTPPPDAGPPLPDGAGTPKEAGTKPDADGPVIPPDMDADIGPDMEPDSGTGIAEVITDPASKYIAICKNGMGRDEIGELLISSSPPESVYIEIQSRPAGSAVPGNCIPLGYFDEDLPGEECTDESVPIGAADALELDDVIFDGYNTWFLTQGGEFLADITASFIPAAPGYSIGLRISLPIGAPTPACHYIFNTNSYEGAE